MTTRSDWILALLKEIEIENVTVTDLDAGIRQLLITHPDSKILEQAK